MLTTGFAGIILLYVGLTIAVVLVVSVVMPTIAGANTTGWGAPAIAIFGVLGLSVIAGLIMMVFK